MVHYIEYLVENLAMPAKAGIVFVLLMMAINLVGELLEAKGRIVPEYIKMRKYFKRKKEERAELVKTLAEAKQTIAETQQTMTAVKEQLQEINLHYSTDNIKMRDGWMQGVNKSLEETDKHFKALDEKMDKNNQDTLEILVENKRSVILDFASKVIDPKYPVTREQFNRVFRVYAEYENIIKTHNMTNGEVDVAIQLIREAYEEHLRKHSFIEDARGHDVLTTK